MLSKFTVRSSGVYVFGGGLIACWNKLKQSGFVIDLNMFMDPEGVSGRDR